jgi:hypothetical protein
MLRADMSPKPVYEQLQRLPDGKVEREVRLTRDGPREIVMRLAAVSRRAMKEQLVATSKFLSLVLRHRPEVIGIELDAEG